MADNEELDMGAEGGDGAAPSTAKKGGLGGLLPGLLKWVIIAVAAIILIVVVVIVTMKIASKNTSTQSALPVSEEYTAKREILDWYTSLGTISTTTCDDLPATVRVDVVLGYKKDDKICSTEITQRTVELKDYLRRYFSGKTAAELKSTSNEEKLKIELKNAINDKILSGSKIRDVVFLQKDVIEQ